MRAACVLVVLIAATSASAQDAGIISGTVVDETHEVLPGATVTLVNEATGAIRTVVTLLNTYKAELS